jgi:hypothetical protein
MYDVDNLTRGNYALNVTHLLEVGKSPSVSPDRNLNLPPRDYTYLCSKSKYDIVIAFVFVLFLKASSEV